MKFSSHKAMFTKQKVSKQETDTYESNKVKSVKPVSQTLWCATLTIASMFSIVMPATLVTQASYAAQTTDNLTAATRLNTLLSNVNSMTAKFSQTTKGVNSNGSSGATMRNGTFSGVMSVQRPNNFRWETTAPFEQLIVANDDTLWIYDPDLEQATRQSAKNQMGSTPALLLSGNPNKIAESFRITQPNSSINYYVLYPKSQNSNFESLGISFSGGKPVMMVLSDSLGQTTSIRFDQVTVNTAIASSKFNFTPPEGTDVIAQ